MAPPRAGTRIAIAQEKLREHLRDHPEMNLSRAMRWLNNERVGGQRLTLRYEEGQAVFNEVRRAPPGQKVLPTVVKPRDVRDPLKVPFMEIARLPPPQPAPSPKPQLVAPPAAVVVDETVARTLSEAGTAERLKWIEEHSLNNPHLTSKDLYDDCRKRFGLGVNAKDILRVLRMVRDAADLPPPLFKHHKPKEPTTVPDLVKPSTDADPNDLLKGAGLKLKHLCAVMKWAKVSLTVNADGSMSYDATPAPVMAMKGEIKL